MNDIYFEMFIQKSPQRSRKLHCINRIKSNRVKAALTRKSTGAWRRHNQKRGVGLCALERDREREKGGGELAESIRKFLVGLRGLVLAEAGEKLEAIILGLTDGRLQTVLLGPLQWDPLSVVVAPYT